MVHSDLKRSSFTSSRNTSFGAKALLSECLHFFAIFIHFLGPRYCLCLASLLVDKDMVHLASPSISIHKAGPFPARSKLHPLISTGCCGKKLQETAFVKSRSFRSESFIVGKTRSAIASGTPTQQYQQWENLLEMEASYWEKYPKNIKKHRLFHSQGEPQAVPTGSNRTPLVPHHLLHPLAAFSPQGHWILA